MHPETPKISERKSSKNLLTYAVAVAASLAMTAKPALTQTPNPTETIKGKEDITDILYQKNKNDLPQILQQHTWAGPAKLLSPDQTTILNDPWGIHTTVTDPNTGQTYLLDGDPTSSSQRTDTLIRPNSPLFDENLSRTDISQTSDRSFHGQLALQIDSQNIIHLVVIIASHNLGLSEEDMMGTESIPEIPGIYGLAHTYGSGNILPLEAIPNHQVAPQTTAIYGDITMVYSNTPQGKQMILQVIDHLLQTAPTNQQLGSIIQRENPTLHTFSRRNGRDEDAQYLRQNQRDEALVESIAIGLLDPEQDQYAKHHKIQVLTYPMNRQNTLTDQPGRFRAGSSGALGQMVGQPYYHIMSGFPVGELYSLDELNQTDKPYTNFGTIQTLIEVNKYDIRQAVTQLIDLAPREFIPLLEKDILTMSQSPDQLIQSRRFELFWQRYMEFVDYSTPEIGQQIKQQDLSNLIHQALNPDSLPQLKPYLPNTESPLIQTIQNGLVLYAAAGRVSSEEFSPLTQEALRAIQQQILNNP